MPEWQSFQLAPNAFQVADRRLDAMLPSVVICNRETKLRGIPLVAAAIMVLAVLWSADRCGAEASVLPKGTELRSMQVIQEGNLGSAAQRVLIATLQGNVARWSGDQIYIDAGGGYTLWKNHLRDAYGVSVSTTTDPWSLVARYRSQISGYILYDRVANSNSVNAATSLSGLFNAVAVDTSIESQVRQAGITNLIADVRTRDEVWVWANYNSLFSRSNIVEQKEAFAHHLRDYATLAKAFTFFDGNSSYRSLFITAMDSDAACLGWGDASQGEDSFVGNSSQRGVFTLAADWALNLSTLSSIRDASVHQHTYAQPVPETNVHYVTLVVTDGDNVQWNLGGLPAYFNHTARGRFNMGWALAPSLADLAPSVLQWYYDAASNGLGRDFFVAGPSGLGYLYPSMYPTADLRRQTQKLADFMARADLNVVQILDFHSFNRLDLWNQYLAQPGIDGLFYLEYAPYNGADGAVLFSTNGRPVIGAREMFWSGLEDEAALIAKLNAAPRDPSSAAGYSFVTVHVWSKNLENVLNVVSNLAAGVRVVAPDAFVKLIRANVGRKLSFDFAGGLQGWAGGTSGKPYDKAQWSSGDGGGALLFDGSDLGSPNADRNSWFSRQIILPPNATALRFDTRAVNDGRLRVRLQRPDGVFVTLLDWDTPANQSWFTRTVSLTGYAGQTVTLYFEQNDGGQGSGEYRLVDNVAVLTSGPPLYLPDAPRLLAASASLTNGVNLLWRDNGDNEAQFKVERRLDPEGDWNEIAVLSGNVTMFVDLTPASGADYSYRVRAWNASGFSQYSNEQQVSTPPKPSLRARLLSNQVALAWPSWATNYALQSAVNLESPGSWLPITNLPLVLGDSLNVSLSIEVSAGRFFRLRSR